MNKLYQFIVWTGSDQLHHNVELLPSVNSTGTVQREAGEIGTAIKFYAT